MPATKISRLNPTHNCFDDAMDYIADSIQHAALTSQPPPLHLMLVHAICRFPVHQANAGELFSHAWVEDGDTCYAKGVAPGLGVVTYAVNRDEYYLELRPVDVTKYTLEEAYKENVRTHSYGPWKEQYLALCRTTKRPESEADLSPTLSTRPSKG